MDTEQLDDLTSEQGQEESAVDTGPSLADVMALLQAQNAEIADLKAARVAPQRHVADEDEDDDPYATQIAARASKQVADALAPYFAQLNPILQQNQLATTANALGVPVDVVSEYFNGLSPEDMAFIAKHPGMSKMAKDAASTRKAAVAPVRGFGGRNDSYEDESGPSSAEQAEIDRALSNVFGASNVQKLKAGKR